MKRYSPVIEWHPDEPAEPGMSEHPNGLYVLASEAQEEIAEARADADASRLERNDAEWDTVRLRALLHDAAAALLPMRYANIPEVERDRAQRVRSLIIAELGGYK